MGLEETKKAIENLRQKYRQSFYLYATKFYAKTIALCLMQLDEEQRKNVQKVFPKEINDSIAEFEENLSKMESADRCLECAVSYILSESGVLTQNDYVELNQAMQDLNSSEFVELYEKYKSSNDSADVWLLEKLKYLCNKASIIQVLNRWPFSMDDLRNVVNKLTFKDFHNIYIFGDDNLKQTVFDTMSNKRYEELLNDFKGIPEPSMEDFKKTLMHIDDLLDEQGVSIENDFSFQ